ncbi:hypothetical protein BCR39DRAFT_540197 [Naematelia encephala]|uniref:Uncharacterized protein n=1 Tax=Naematelia encephala TaxID=71784 RepID=A0A1Y2AW61_9TREE|nr:hypothetical protein BCR39DRAFT_540197 [Naematelia encephala]
MDTHEPHRVHVVFIPVSLRSHLRILIQLCLNLLKANPQWQGTLLYTAVIAGSVQEELELQEQAFLSTLGPRLAHVVIEDGLTPPAAAYEERMAFKATCEGPLRELIRGKDGLNPPTAFISDMLRTSIRKQVHEVCDELASPRIPVLHLYPSMALSLHRFLNKYEDGGSCDQATERMKLYQEEGLSKDDSVAKALRSSTGRLLRWPDLPDMYDYEYTPQYFSRKHGPGGVVVQKLVFTVSRNTDGIICNGLPEMDGASLARVADLIQVPCFGVGPQFNERTWAKAEEKETEIQHVQEDDVFHFLDKALQQHGAKSVCYISLGSIFWPTLRPEIITVILRSLLDLSIPFVFATAASDATIPEELLDEVKRSGRGLIVKWVPQVQVLKHKAIGAFLTHCGWGSITESIIAGVPIIALPFGQDQPSLAAHFTKIQRIGIQLNHFSSGNDGCILGDGTVVISSIETMKAELTDVLKRLRGPEGDACRQQAETVREVFKASWESGGSRQEMAKLAKHIEQEPFVVKS